MHYRVQQKECLEIISQYNPQLGEGGEMLPTGKICFCNNYEAKMLNHSWGLVIDQISDNVSFESQQNY